MTVMLIIHGKLHKKEASSTQAGFFFIGSFKSPF